MGDLQGKYLRREEPARGMDREKIDGFVEENGGVINIEGNIRVAKKMSIGRFSGESINSFHVEESDTNGSEVTDANDRDRLMGTKSTGGRHRGEEKNAKGTKFTGPSWKSRGKNQSSLGTTRAHRKRKLPSGEPKVDRICDTASNVDVKYRGNDEYKVPTSSESRGTGDAIQNEIQIRKQERTERIRKIETETSRLWDDQGVGLVFGGKNRRNRVPERNWKMGGEKTAQCGCRFVEKYSMPRSVTRDQRFVVGYHRAENVASTRREAIDIFEVPRDDSPARSCRTSASSRDFPKESDLSSDEEAYMANIPPPPSLYPFSDSEVDT